MTKGNIYTLTFGGLQMCTAHSLDPIHAYALYKLKRFVEKNFESIEEEKKGIAQSVISMELEAFNAERSKLIGQPTEKLSEKEKTRLDELNDKHKRFEEMINELLKDEIDTSSLILKPIPYTEWHKLQNENKQVHPNGNPNISLDVLSGDIESILENVFWSAPEE